MGQRNMVYSGAMLDTEIEPSVIPHGWITRNPQPNNTILPQVNHHGPPPSGVAPPADTNMFIAAPRGVRVIPLPISHLPPNQLQFPGNQFMVGAFKRKVSEGFPVNFQYCYPAPGSGAFVGPEYGGTDMVPVVMGPGLARDARARAAGVTGLDPGLQMVPLSHGGQPLQVVPTTPWLDQRFCSNVPGIPYMQGYNGYQVTAANGNSVAFVHPAPIAPPPPLPPMLPLQSSHNMAASTSRRLLLQNGVELGPRFVGPTPFGIGVYQPRHQELIAESTSRHRGYPRLRVLPEDGVAILNISNYGRPVDHHRDMRLDIDHMSYEELLALGEQIGSVGSGLSDGFILEHLKTRTFASSKSSSHLEDASSADQELEFCTICQTDYNDQEKIGVLDCSHEYHVGCIKKWLLEKNTCPVCKSTALATQGKESGFNCQKTSSARS